jgi:hypothetical protein
MHYIDTVNSMSSSILVYTASFSYSCEAIFTAVVYFDTGN